MSSWRSLQGYLGYKPGGALGRLKVRRRCWYAFEESTCQLLGFRSEAEATSKKPETRIDVAGAAIALDPNHSNQFIVHSEGKDHVFTAENHESTMAWVIGLQTKRDAFDSRSTSPFSSWEDQHHHHNLHHQHPPHPQRPPPLFPHSTSLSKIHDADDDRPSLPLGVAPSTNHVSFDSNAGRPTNRNASFNFRSANRAASFDIRSTNRQGDASFRHSMDLEEAGMALAVAAVAGDAKAAGTRSYGRSSATSTLTRRHMYLRRIREAASTSNAGVAKPGKVVLSLDANAGEAVGSRSREFESQLSGFVGSLSLSEANLMNFERERNSTISCSSELMSLYHNNNNNEALINRKGNDLNINNNNNNNDFQNGAAASSIGDVSFETSAGPSAFRVSSTPLFGAKTNFGVAHPLDAATTRVSAAAAAAGTADHIHNDVGADFKFFRRKASSSSSALSGEPEVGVEARVKAETRGAAPTREARGAEIGGDEADRGKSRDSFSGHSSSDSAIAADHPGSADPLTSHPAAERGVEAERGAGEEELLNQTEMKARMRRLEKELINAKTDLAAALNRESCYKAILHRRESTIMDLDHKLERVGSVGSVGAIGPDGVETPGVGDGGVVEHGPTFSRQNSQGFSARSPEEEEVERGGGGGGGRSNRMSVTSSFFSELTGAKSTKRLQETLRVLQNQNKFLNEEVMKLAQLRQHDSVKIQESQRRLQSQEASIDAFKRDYVLLLQGSVQVSSNDLKEMEIHIWGGSKPRERITELLEEARAINPALPTFESLSKEESHVDAYGFRHSHADEGMILHYICRQLWEHYVLQLRSHESWQLQWREYLGTHPDDLVKTKELKALTRAGIPPYFRAEVWRRLVAVQVKDIKTQKGQHYFTNLVTIAHESPHSNKYRKQISMDLLRTMPNNVHFCKQESDGVAKLEKVLMAFCVHNPTLGYCQGMNFIAGMMLLFLEPEDSFWGLVAVTEKYFSTNYFDQNLIGAQADQEVLKELMREKLPELSSHLVDIDIEISTITLIWFLAIFFDCVPLETLLRIWDCFLLEGPKVLFRFSLAILRLHEASLLAKCDTIGIMRHLKSMSKITFDIEGLMKTAFVDLKPFPRRQDIRAKQQVYIKVLREKVRRHEMERKTVLEREQLYKELELSSGAGSRLLIIECAAVYDKTKVWICQGEQNTARICKVNLVDNIMFDISLDFDSRIMCIHGVDQVLPSKSSNAPSTSTVMILGTLSWHLYAYLSTTREELWQVHLNDAVLGVCCLEVYPTCDELRPPCPTPTSASASTGPIYRIVAALADGTLAVLEHGPVKGSASKPGTAPTHSSGIMNAPTDMFYIPVGHSPISAILRVDDAVWCACANRVHILNANTMDHRDSFVVTNNPYDHVADMIHSELGVWISIRGSSVVELWDPVTLACRMIFNVKENKMVNLNHEDETAFHEARLTAFLPFDDQLWVGTADGFLMMFDVIERRPGDDDDDDVKSVDADAGNRTGLPVLNQLENRLNDLYDRQLASPAGPFVNNNNHNGATGIKIRNRQHNNVNIKHRWSEPVMLPLGSDSSAPINPRLFNAGSETNVLSSAPPISPNVSPSISQFRATQGRLVLNGAGDAVSIDAGYDAVDSSSRPSASYLARPAPPGRSSSPHAFSSPATPAGGRTPSPHLKVAPSVVRNRSPQPGYADSALRSATSTVNGAERTPTTQRRAPQHIRRLDDLKRQSSTNVPEVVGQKLTNALKERSRSLGTIFSLGTTAVSKIIKVAEESAAWDGGSEKTTPVGETGETPIGAQWETPIAATPTRPLPAYAASFSPSLSKMPSMMSAPMPPTIQCSMLPEMPPGPLPTIPIIPSEIPPATPPIMASTMPPTMLPSMLQTAPATAPQAHPPSPRACPPARRESRSFDLEEVIDRPGVAGVADSFSGPSTPEHRTSGLATASDRIALDLPGSSSGASTPVIRRREFSVEGRSTRSVDLGEEIRTTPATMVGEIGFHGAAQTGVGTAAGRSLRERKREFVRSRPCSTSEDELSRNLPPIPGGRVRRQLPAEPIDGVMIKSKQVKSKHRRLPLTRDDSGNELTCESSAGESTKTRSGRGKKLPPEPSAAPIRVAPNEDSSASIEAASRVLNGSASVSSVSSLSSSGTLENLLGEPFPDEVVKIDAVEVEPATSASLMPSTTPLNLGMKLSPISETTEGCYLANRTNVLTSDVTGAASKRYSYARSSNAVTLNGTSENSSTNSTSTVLERNKSFESAGSARSSVAFSSMEDITNAFVDNFTTASGSGYASGIDAPEDFRRRPEPPSSNLSAAASRLEEERVIKYESSSQSSARASSTSSISYVSSTVDVPFTHELSLQARLKIADKPVKVLLQTIVKGIPTIISCTGCYGDDEAVLQWIREPQEKIWTNQPVVEVCPVTLKAKPPSYMRMSTVKDCETLQDVLQNRYSRRLSLAANEQSGDSTPVATPTSGDGPGLSPAGATPTKTALPMNPALAALNAVPGSDFFKDVASSTESMISTAASLPSTLSNLTNLALANTSGLR